jgi:hypothetical protein
MYLIDRNDQKMICKCSMTCLCCTKIYASMIPTNQSQRKCSNKYDNSPASGFSLLILSAMSLVIEVYLLPSNLPEPSIHI